MCLGSSLAKQLNCFNAGSIGKILVMSTVDAEAAAFVIGTTGVTENVITAATLASLPVYELAFDLTKTAAAPTTQADDAIKSWDVGITATVTDRSLSAHLFFQKYSYCCPLIAFVQDNNGVRKAYGINYNPVTHTVLSWVGLSPAVDDQTGDTIEAGAQYDVRLTGKQNYLGLVVSDTVWNSLLTNVVP